MKKSIFFLSMFVALEAYAQTGINTTLPKATLDIAAKNTNGSTPEGLKTPQLTGDAVKAMSANLGADQNGMLLYITSAVSSADTSTINISVPGYYRFNYASDGTTTTKNWVRMEPSGLEKLKLGNNYGWRYIGANPASYNGLGNGATDLSYVPAAAEESRFLDYTYATPDGSEQVTYGYIKNVLTNGNYQGYTLPNSSFNINKLGAVGHNSFAAGLYNLASGIGSTTLGIGNVASGDLGSVAAGFGNTSTDTSVVLGLSNYGSGKSTAIGFESKATLGSYAIGNYAEANNESMAIGVGAVAKENRSFAFGLFSQALGPYSTALQGGITKAHSAFSVRSSSAEGFGSYAIGIKLKALAPYETVMGVFNTFQNRGDINTNPYWQTNQRLFTVGNGYASNSSFLDANASDAFTILKNAKVGISVDNFEKTSSDAKLQVNGKVLIGDFGDNSTNNNIISLAPTSDASLNVIGDIKIGSKNINCNSTNEGALRYVTVDSNNGAFQGCKKTAGAYSWVTLTP